MEVKKGITGRRVCGTLEAVFGGFLFLGSIVNAVNGAVNIFGFLAAVFIIVTGSLGIASKKFEVIIGYMVAGIICALSLGFFTIGGIVVVANYEDYDYYLASYSYEDASTIRVTLIIALLIIAVAFIVSVLGVIFACVPLCARNHEQDTFQRFNEPAGAVGPPPDYNYSNTGYVHTAQTQQNNYDNKSVVGIGAPPNYNNSNTAFVDTKQGLV